MRNIISAAYITSGFVSASVSITGYFTQNLFYFFFFLARCLQKKRREYEKEFFWFLYFGK